MILQECLFLDTVLSRFQHETSRAERCPAIHFVECLDGDVFELQGHDVRGFCEFSHGVQVREICIEGDIGHLLSG